MVCENWGRILGTVSGAKMGLEGEEGLLRREKEKSEL